MRDDILTVLQRDGFVVLDDFLDETEIEEVKKAGTEFAENVPKEERKIVFSSTNSPQSKDTYFLESGDKIRYFFESDALDESGNLKVPASQSLNKVGHALHWLHPTFKKLSFGEKVVQICRYLQLEVPVILQSMYIYKNPGIGGEVTPHQDATFLFTEPDTLIGFWIPIDDATLENGCLWFIPGSHKSGVHRRYIKNQDANSDELLIFDCSPTLYPSSSFRACPVSKGSCVIIHGQVVHKSDYNKSSKSRHAYTFHVMDGTSTYSSQNWLQSEKGFPAIYS